MTVEDAVQRLKLDLLYDGVNDMRGLSSEANKAFVNRLTQLQDDICGVPDTPDAVKTLARTVQGGA